MSRAMKYSGNKWIGEIPETWGVERIKTIFSERTELSEDGSETLLSVSEYYGVANRAEKIDDGEYVSRAESLIGYKKCYKGDLVSNIMLAWKGSMGITEYDGIVSPAYCVYEPSKSVFPRYYHYLFRTSLYTSIFRLYSKGIIDSRLRLYSPYFFDIKAIIPSYSEQQRIAEFLDRKCAEVDEMIALQEQIIEELKAYKQSVITEAVTKGLNPAAPMRDSEIVFVDKIPSHWKETKTLRLLSMPITDGPHETPDGLDDGIPFISADAVSDGYINFDNKWGYISQKYYEECCKKYIPQKYDIYMIKSGASTGRTAIVETDEIFTIWSPLAVFRANTNIILPYFLLYVLRSDYYQKQVENKWSFGTQQNIGMRVLEKLLISYPPITEQQAIADYLDEKCADIDSLIQTKQSKIDSLKEYKKSIIYEYVTGKREAE